MIIVTLYVNVTPERRPEIIELFSSYVGPISFQPGCISIQLYSQYISPDDFILIEKWKSQSALQRHIQSDDFQKILGIIDLGNEPPDIQFHSVSSVEGFELVKKLREDSV
jgi:quinol monooxygenase YgiN